MQNQELQNSLSQLRRRLFTIYAVSLLFLIGVALISNQILKNQAALQATAFIRRMVKLGDFKETIITLSQAKLDYFEAVAYFDDQETLVFSLPVDLNPHILAQKKPSNSLRYGYINNQIFFDSAEHSPLGVVVFAYQRYAYLPYALGLWLLLVISTLPLIASARRAVVERYEGELKIRSELARAELARKVRHDIRSPLVALQGFLSTTENLNADERGVLDRTVSRIFGIIADLEDAPTKQDDSALDSTAVDEVAIDVVREKLLHLTKPIQISCNIDASGFLAFTSMTRTQLSRVISNLINNSLDAIEERGTVEVSLRVALGTVILKVTDTGKGIPPSVLPRIFDKNFSFEKTTGSGIGLSSAKEALEAEGGKISAQSIVGEGASIVIELPVRNQPPWWVDRLDLLSVETVVIIDDQETSHDAWRMKLKGIASCVFMKTETDLREWLNVHKTEKTLFLVDFDLGADHPNGIELLEKYNLADHAILVTGHFDDNTVRAECWRLKLRLLPKTFIDAIAIA